MVSTGRSDYMSGSEFQRPGGCFVTTKRAIMFFLLAVCLALVVAGLMYFYGPSINNNPPDPDIEKLINDTINEMEEEELQLAGLVYPLYYRLRLQPDLDNLTYTGRVTITLRSLRHISEIVLHSVGIKINENSLNLTTTELVQVKDLDNHIIDKSEVYTTEKFKRDITINDTNTTDEFNVLQEARVHEIDILSHVQEKNSPLYRIKTSEYLDPHLNYTLDIIFTGRITEDLRGFYKASFQDLKGNEQTIATTEFEPIFARRVFPCFDEPAYKAQFEISIARPTNMMTLSNMPLRATEHMSERDGWVWDHFRVSPLMSTYTVSFTIFNYKAIESAESVGPVLKFWAPEDKLEGASYVLECAARIIKFMENYLDMPFPLQKIDFVVIPNFIRESSENWGLIYLSDEALINEISSPYSSSEAKTKIFHTVAHDLTHQWFGNLVTMKWWSDIWLNEGLANYLSNVIEDNLEPEWEVANNYALETSEVALTLDKLKTTHSLKENITNTVKIEQIFDELVMKKGSCLMKMLEFTLTENSFRKGLQTYLKKFAFNSTTEEDFWLSFPTGPEVILPNATLRTIMESWTIQTGYPIVTVKRNYITGHILISQHKFLEQNETDGTLWYIPLSYKVSNDPKQVKMWLVEKELLVRSFSRASPKEWILFNVGQTGFYRVNYDLDNWYLLINQLRENHTKIPLANRAQLIDDAFELAENGVLKYEIPIRLLKYLARNETQYAPWVTALNNLELLNIIFHNTKFNGMFQNYKNNLILPLYTRFFPENKVVHPDNIMLNEKQLRTLILETACHANFKPCIEWAQNAYHSWMMSPDGVNPIPYAYREVAYCTAIKMGGSVEWDFLWNQTKGPMASGELRNVYLALGCSRDPWIINSYLEHTLDESIPLQNVPDVWQSIKRSVGLHIGFKFLRLNWDEIRSKFGEMYSVMETIFDDFLSRLSSKVDLEDLTVFYRYNSKTLTSVAPLVKQSVDKIKLRIYWWEKHMANVTKWLNQ